MTYPSEDNASPAARRLQQRLTDNSTRRRHLDQQKLGTGGGRSASDDMRRASKHRAYRELAEEKRNILIAMLDEGTAGPPAKIASALADTEAEIARRREAEQRYAPKRA